MKRILAAFLAAVLVLSLVPVMAEETAIIDESFENGNGLFGQRGTVQLVNTDKAAYSGKKSLLLDGRGADAWNGPSANVTDKVKLDEVYYLRMYARAAKEGESFHVKFIFEQSDDNGKTYPNVVNGLVSSDEWTLIEGYWTADYKGTLGELNLCVETEENGIGKSFYIDDVFFAQADVTPSEPTVSEPEEEGPVSVTDPYNNYVVPASIVGSDVENQFGFLTTFGILNYGADAVIDLDANLTRGEFMEYIYRMYSQGAESAKAAQIFHDVPETHPNAEAIAYAYNNGLVAGDGRGFFEPDELVTYQHATKILMTMLGYGPEDVSSAVSAKSAGLLDSITTEGILQPITYRSLFELLYNAMHANVMVRTVYGGAVTGYTYMPDKTFMSEYYEVEQLNGIVNANAYTSLDEGDSTALGYVRVGNSTFKEKGTSGGRLLGYYVKAYYKRIDNTTDFELVYIDPVETKNSTFVITDDNFVNYNNFKYSYENENYDVKTKDIVRDFTLVYNHRAIKPGDNFDISMMKPELGSITLLANDGSTDYSIVIVEDYRTLVVSALDKTNFTVYDKLGIKDLVLDEEEADSFIDLVDATGNKVEITSLKENDVISYLASSGTYRPVITGIRSKTKVTGVINSISSGTDEVKVVIGDKEYDVSPHFIDAGFTVPALGDKVTVYLDAFGNIAFIGESSYQGLSTAYLVASGRENSIDQRGELKLFMPDGEFQCFKMADKIKYKNGRLTYNEMLTELAKGGIGGNAKQQIIAFSTNADGYINRIDLPHASEDAALTANDGNTFHRVIGTEEKNTDGSNKFTFKNTIDVFFKVGYGFFAANDRTVIYAVPQPGSEDCYDEDSYSIVKLSSLINNTSHTIDPFTIGYDTVPVTCAVKYDAVAEKITSQEVYILTKHTAALDSEGMDTIAIRVFKDSAEQKLYLKSTEVWDEATANNGGKELKSGDIVRFETNSKGQITKLEKSTVINSYDDEFAGMEGYIFRKKGNWAYFTTEMPAADTKLNGNMILVPLDQFAITIYSSAAKTANAGTPADIRDYETVGANCSKVYMTLNYENPISLIVIEP